MMMRHAGPAGRLTPERRMGALTSGGDLSGWCEVRQHEARGRGEGKVGRHAC